MEKLKLNEFDEIRYIIPGRTYRSDHDATHSPMFHQCEGLVLGKNINMGHLKGCLIEFCRTYSNSDNLNSSKFSTSSLINFLSIFIFDNFS